MESTPEPAELFMVEIRVRDLGRSLAWYRRVLGLGLRLADEPKGFALLGAGTIGVALKQGAESPADRRSARLTFRVADVDRQRDRLLAAGVAVSEPIINKEEGYREIRLADPDGTPISLFCWATDGGAPPPGAPSA